MFPSRPVQPLLEADRREFLAAKMWLSMGVTSEAPFDSNVHMMEHNDHEFMSDYTNMITNGVMPMQTFIPHPSNVTPQYLQQDRHKQQGQAPEHAAIHQNSSSHLRFNTLPSTRGRRSDRSSYNGRGRGKDGL